MGINGVTQSKAIECKWVFKFKTKYDGTLDNYKTRLVVKGNTQKPGIDYEDIYLPMAKFNLKLCQMGVRTLFLRNIKRRSIYRATK